MSKDPVFQSALGKLRRRPYFSQELRKKLGEEGASAPEVHDVLQRLESLGFLNDEERLEAFVHYAIRQGKGPLWVRQKFYEKGTLHLEEKLYEAYSKEKQIESIKNFLRKAPSEPQKKIAFFARRGFPLSLIKQVIHY